MATPIHPTPRTNARPVVIDVVDPASNESARQRRSALLQEALAENLPAPTKRGKGWRILLLVAGLIMAIVLGVVVMNVDRGTERGDDDEVVKTFEQGIAPPPPGIEDATQVGEINRDTSLITTQRGWIQATDNGQLAQEYRYASSEPSPGGRVHMTKPEVKIYMKDRRVLTLRGETADVLAPNKALESGTMTGHVLIRLYEVAADRQLDETVDTPLLEVRTPEASFDNFQGDVICPGEVDIQTATAHLPAVGLRMQINDMEGRPGQLIIDRINGELRLSEKVQDQTKPDAGAESKPKRSAGDASKATAGPARRETLTAKADPPARDREQRQRDRARERREMRFQQPAPIEKSEGPYFYRLTMTQNVRVRQGDGSIGWTALCDQMHMIFSLDNNDISGSLSRRVAPAPIYGPMEPLRLEQTLAALTIASMQESTSVGGLFSPSDTDTIIRCDGPLTMVPLKNAAEQPGSAEDTRFELIGSPVVLHNNEDATNVYCASLQYASLSEVMELIGSPQHGLVIDSPDLHAEGERFWVDRLNSDGAFEGPGWMVAGESDRDSKAATQPALPLERREDVRIAWSDGVDLEFEPASKVDSNGLKPGDAHESFGRLKLATFNGTVAVQSPDFTLDANRMDVGFPARPIAAIAAGVDATSKPDSGQQLASIEFIHAEGGVKAGSMSDGGSIHCSDLRVNFENHDGKTVPLNMLANGEVAAVDREKQTVWSDQLNVAFKPVAPRPEAGVAQPAASQPAATQPGGKSNRRADVESLTATGGVQIQMSDGARVFADRLEADGEGHMIVLTGEDVMVVSDRNIINKGKRLELTERGATVTWPGPGEFAYYTSPILPVVEANRVARPMVDLTANPRQMLARWNQSMVYDGTYDNGAGSIVIRGNVDAQSTPSPLELNTMTGDQVTLLFAKAEITAAPPATLPQAATTPATQPGHAGGGLFAMEQQGRQLKELIAVGHARLESRTWLSENHVDKPRVFWLSGEHVTYNDQSLDAIVQGKGELLVRDERPEPAATQPQTKPGPGERRADLPFGARGTTLFRWSDSLRMTRRDRESSLYDIVMLGGVEVRHLALDKSVATMTGDRLEATVDRTQGAAERDAGFDLGGSMDMKRIHAQGNVYVDSPKRDVDCDEFDYDYVTGIAQLNAREGRSVTVVTAGNAHPVQARSFLWNTIDDTVTVRNVSGASGR